MGNKKNQVSLWVVIALALCLVSMIGASLIQSSGNRVSVEKLKWVDSYGRSLSALLYKPNTATTENPAPAIITIEGWFNNKEMQDLYSVEYARRGYVVLALDMYSHGDSESLSATEVYGPGAVGEDGAVQLVGTLPYVDKSRIALTGHSSGGAAMNMAMAIDNEREKPLISAMFYEASTWNDDTGVDHSAEYGERNVGIIADKYDEFFFWTQDENGNDVPPKEWLTTDEAKNFVNFNNGAEGMDDVEPGKYYTDADKVRVIYQPTMIHPWVHFSKTCVGYGIEFFEKVFGAPNPIDPSNQIWQWKTFFNALGLVGVFIFCASFALAMLNTGFFSSLKAAKPVEALAAPKGIGMVWYWGVLALGALFSGLSYWWTIQNIYSKTTPFFTSNGPLLIGVWCALSGTFALIMMIIYYNCYGKKNGVHPSERGVKISMPNLGKTILLALMSTALGFIILFFADFFFKTDFRLWVLTLRTFESEKVIFGLRYLPFFLYFYIINSISANVFNYNGVGGKSWLNTLIFGFFNALGAIVFCLIQYVTFFNTGYLKWYASEGQRISGIWLFPVIIFLFFTPFITRWVYKKTNNPYLAPIILAILITMMAVANTTTLVGGGALVAANY